jgi:hypothetical protein
MTPLLPKLKVIQIKLSFNVMHGMEEKVWAKDL